MPSPRLAILSHPHQRTLPSFYLLNHMAQLWARQGWTIDWHYGVQRGRERALARADQVFLHIDLSVVPAHYRDFVADHPRVVNRDILDICKRTYSRNRVLPGDGYEGPVILKTSLNSAGHSEYRATYGRGRRLWHRLRKKHQYLSWHPALMGLLKPEDVGKYAILSHRGEVPTEVWDSEQWIVERFLPERSGEAFVVREWYFLHDCEFYNCEISLNPIISSDVERLDLASPPPPELRQWRQDLGIEFGRIDYVITEDGETVLFDVNKTPALPAPLTATGCAIASALAAALPLC